MKGGFFLLLVLGWALLGGTLLRANSDVYRPLTPPRAADIVAFTNGLPPAVGVRTPASRGQILRFLQRGKNDLRVESWYPLQHPEHGGIENCDGVMVDRRGLFYFWSLNSRRTLTLQTPDGRTALLRLP